MKLFILGLDGATFDILNPLMEEELIPNIKSLCMEGICGPMRTIFPPVTAPAWLALATGLNPGKTGVFDYINKEDDEGQAFTPISSASYEKRAIWDYLNENGHEVGIFNYPTLSPPPPVNGFVVSGMGGKKGNMCYPNDLEDELDKITKGYESKLNLRNPKYNKNIDLFFSDINRILTKQEKALLHLIKTKMWDFFFAVFSVTDWMGHVLWRHIDEKHPLYDPNISPNVKNKFKATWRRIDSFIGQLLNILPDRTHFMIVSDHGMGPLESVFYANRWLEEKGWLKRKNLGWKGFFIDKIKLFSEGSDNKYYNAIIYRLKTKILKIKGTTDLIDFENSLAYSPEHNTMFGCINLTWKGKATIGFREEMLTELNSIVENVEGIKSIKTYYPEEIYSGPLAYLSPDILFIINDHRSTVEIDFSKESFSNSPSIKMRTGGHLMDGVFIVKGELFKNDNIKNVSILDIAPTILALYGAEIPSEMDGKVILESIKPELLNSVKVRIRKDKGINIEQREKKDKDELEEMKKMLKSLGYL